MTALSRLAARCGIEPGFRNALGEDVEPETQIRLLKCMGVKVESERVAAAALAELERQAWRPGMPPVIVTRSNADACAVEAVLPAATRLLHWHVRLEDGTGRHVSGNRPQSSSLYRCSHGERARRLG
jgi:hypothetical protein